MPEDDDHIEATVQQMAKLHSEHEKTASRLQRTANVVTDRLGRPGVLLWILAFETVWIGLNLVPVRTLNIRFDEPPFAILNLLVSALALNVTF